ncbi:MAG: site-specific integrase, partial [Odoribacteraceae bacterium]|nr:site-specific integrase [Odoribacteraceae bacterium]
MRPCKIEHGFIQCKNDRERRANGEKLIAEYTAKLRNGWVPWRDPAAIYEDEINYESENRAYGKARSATRTVRKLLSEYLSFKKMSVKQKSFKTYQSKLRKFSAWLEENHYAGHDITVIDNRIIVEFFTYLIEVRGLDQCSIKNYRITLSGFFNYLRRNKRVRFSPVENIPTGLKMKDEAPRPVMPEDLDLLLNHVRARDGQLYLACLMQFFCAIRPGTEMRLLKVKDINFFMRTITVTSVNAKTTRKRCVNVPAQFFELMTKGYGLNKQDKEAYVFGREGRPGDVPMGVNSFRCRFNRFRDELGLSKDYKFYSMKHTGA